MSDVTDQWELAPPHTEREAPFVAVPDPTTAAAVGLDAPVRNLQMLELQITGGATEIYLAQRAPADTAVSLTPCRESATAMRPRCPTGAW
ncbi:hypothetical protein LV779_35845 [Streptomyces thinghirensis]|nr:hypothetical protein [Streptomyces thinghirensis]